MCATNKERKFLGTVLEMGVGLPKSAYSEKRDRFNYGELRDRRKIFWIKLDLCFRGTLILRFPNTP